MPRSSALPARSGRVPLPGPGRTRPFLALPLLLCLTAGTSFAANDPEPARRAALVLLPEPGARAAAAVQDLPAQAARERDASQGRLHPGEAAVRPGLLSRYRIALERESRRSLDRDPSIFWAESHDEDGYPMGRARREARRIFDGANGRIISEIAEDLIQEAVALRTARAYLDGVRLDVMKEGGVLVRAGRGEGSFQGREEVPGPAGPGVKASFGLVGLGAPRFEFQTTMPGDIRTRIEVPLASPGIRATFSRRITSNLRGTLALGTEDAGAEQWVTAGLGVRF